MKPLRDEHFAILRRHMVELIRIQTELLSEELGKAALDEAVLAAMQRVPRHLFVPAAIVHLAYEDAPLPIGFGKTISQPFMNALMIDLLAPGRGDAILEIGTGLGYQAAILADLVGRVWSVEIVEEFASQAETRLQDLGYSLVGIRVGDGSRGWAEHAPYDRMIVSAASEEPPRALLQQLRPGGRMVMPLGPEEEQQLTVIDIDADGGVKSRRILPVRFTRLETMS